MPSRFSSALTLALSTRRRPAGVTRRNRFRPGFPAREPSILPRSAAVSASVLSMTCFELRDQAVPDGGVAFCLVRVVADDEPVAVVAEADFLDLEVVADFLVAALAGQGGPDLRGAGAELLADDVPAAAPHQGAAVLFGGEAAVGDPDDLGQGPFPQVGLDLADQAGVGGVPGPGPDADRDPVAGDGHADDDLGQVVAGVLGLPVRAEPGLACLVLAVRGYGLAARLARYVLVCLFCLEIGGCRVPLNRLISRSPESATRR